MKTKLPFFLLLASLALVSLSFQEPAGSQNPAPIDPSEMDPAEMMAAMMAVGAPGEEHKELMALAGEWETKIKMRMSPDAPWEEYTGKSKLQKALGGRYLIEKFSAEMGMMGNFEGILILGFNNLTKQYESIWMDSFSTSPSTTTGVINEEGHIVMKGLMKDLITPEGRPFRHVTIPNGKDHYTTKMFDTIPPVGDVLVMEIEYTRAK